MNPNWREKRIAGALALFAAGAAFLLAGCGDEGRGSEGRKKVSDFSLVDGGARFIVEIEPDGDRPVQKEDQDEVVRVLRERIGPDAGAWVGADPDSGNRVEIRGPWTEPEEVASIREIIQRTAKLEIAFVHREADTSIDRMNAIAGHEQGDLVLIGAKFAEGYGGDEEKRRERSEFVEFPPSLDGRSIKDAWASSNGPAFFQIDVRLDSAGGATMQKLTAANVGRRMAILIDGQCLTAPMIQGAFGGEFRITGDFDQAEAEFLATMLRNPLQNKLVILEEAVISPANTK